MKFPIRSHRLLFVLALLAGCGGGSDTPAPTSMGTATGAPSAAADSIGFAQVQGAYAGTIGPVEGRALVLENGDTWVLSGASDVNRVFIPVGVSHGQGNLSGNTLQANFLTESLAAGVDGNSIVGNQRIIASGDSIPLSLSKANVLGYNYNDAASGAAVAGAWQVQSGTGGSLTIAPDGSLSGTSLGTATCAVAAVVKPRTSGKNVYDLSGSVSGAGCTTAGPLSGFAMIYVDALNRQQLLMPIEVAGQRAVLRAQRCPAGTTPTQCGGTSITTTPTGTGTAPTTPQTTTPMVGGATPGAQPTSPTSSLSARVTAAPADGSDGSIICAFPRLEVAGTGMKNVELVPDTALAPVIARFAVSSDGTLATLAFDALPRGTSLRVRIVAYDSDPGQPGTMVVAMEARTWNIGNPAEPPCLSPGSQTAS